MSRWDQQGRFPTVLRIDALRLNRRGVGFEEPQGGHLGMPKVQFLGKKSADQAMPKKTKTKRCQASEVLAGTGSM